MKLYKLKMSRDCWSSDRMPKRDKTFNSSERWRAKREIEAELKVPETSQWQEIKIKEYYENSYSCTIKLIYTLQRLNIYLFPDDDLRAFYDESYFVEEAIRPPKGWQWWRGKLEKI